MACQNPAASAARLPTFQNPPSSQQFHPSPRSMCQYQAAIFPRVCHLFTDSSPIAFTVTIHHTAHSLLGSDSWQAERHHSDMDG